MEKFLQNTKSLGILETSLSEVFNGTGVEYYIVGSQLIDNIKSNDIDVLLCYDDPINIAELRATRKVIWQKMNADGLRYNLIFNFKADNTKLKSDYLYYDIINKDSSKVDYKTMGEKDYTALKLHLRKTLPFRSKFYKSIIKSKEVTPRVTELLNMIKQ